MDPRSRTDVALAELTAALRGRFGARLHRLTLFGSRARGEAHEESDVDVLVVIDDLAASEKREVDAFVGDALTRHDVLISTLLVSRADLERLAARGRLIVREIERDAIAL
jgi:predicted nucleotidyltransferase